MFYIKLFVGVMVLSFMAGFEVFAQTNATSGLEKKIGERFVPFENELEQLRSVLKIPGMSAGVVKDGKLIWSKGFGYSDYETKTPATPETPYETASITKTFAAILLMQLVEQGKVNLDDSMSKYSTTYKDDKIKVRHVLTHTSEGLNPGEKYAYNGNLFGSLFDVIVNGSSKRFRLLIAENILDKLNTVNSSPGNDITDDPVKMAEQIGEVRTKNYGETLKRTAKSYKLYGADDIVPTFSGFRGLNPASGVISSVTDLARYDAEIDANRFVSQKTRDLMWTPATLNNGQAAPYGLGWFVQNFRGTKLVWHYGNLQNSYSALILKVPEKHVSFILLANSDALSSPFKLAPGDVSNSPFALSFLRSFLSEEEKKIPFTAPIWGSDSSAFLKQTQTFERNSKGYKYDAETAANAAIRTWLDTRKSEAHTAIRLDPKVYDSYIGEYQVGTNPTFKIVVENGKLMREGRNKFELFPESETTFFAKSVDAMFIFAKGNMGPVSELRIKQGESEFSAKRVSSSGPKP